MFSSKMVALAAAASVLVATAPAAAQTAVPAEVRVGAEIDAENNLFGGGLWAALIGVALIAAFILVVIEDDDVDLPTSP